MFDLRWITMLAFALAGFVLSVDPARAFLAYVSNEKSNTVSVIDTDKMETIATIKTGQRPRGIEVSRDGKLVYVALGDDDIIQIIDTKSLTVVSELPSGPDPEQFAIDPAGKTLYVANENDAMVTVIDLEKRASVGEVSVGIEPEGMAVSPDFQDSDLYVRNDQHGPFHRHREPPARGQSVGRISPTLFRIQG